MPARGFPRSDLVCFKVLHVKWFLVVKEPCARIGIVFIMFGHIRNTLT